MTRVVGWLAVVLWTGAAAAHAAESFALSHELWDRPRTAKAVLEQPAVKQALHQHLAVSGSRLVIHHSQGAAAALQAGELRMWLMALAVDGARIDLAGDLKQNEPLRIEVAK